MLPKVSIITPVRAKGEVEVAWLEISIRRLVHEVLAACEVAGRKVEFDTSKPDGHKRRAVDTSRLRSLIDWEPPTLLEETLAKMVGEYRAGRSWL